ncbi:bacteriophage holin [Candidatus Woesearchaeota archaeon]|nr:bacteriophage holin [Candidatus Woesearchaeota archaeon]
MAKKKGIKISSTCSSCKLNTTKFGLTLGILWGLAVLLLGIAATYASYGTEFVNLLGGMYIGFDTTLIGSIVGGIWGFFDGLIGGFIFAWLYNKLI